jgi:hypothetical protein
MNKNTLSPKELEQTAHEIITGKIERGEAVQMHWAVTEFLNTQPEITGPGAPFYRLCARDYAYRLVKKAVDKYDESARPGDAQMTLEGYEYLQEAYTVERDGERQLVPIHSATAAEMLQRATEYEKMGAGCYGHAREIRHYVADRDEGGLSEAL